MKSGDNSKMSRRQSESGNYEQFDTDEPSERRCPKVLLAFIIIYIVVLVVFIIVAVLMRRQSSRPHIVLIIADDLGWSDVSWRDPNMRTPSLEALLKDGVLFNNSYVHPLDGPSRAAMFTGMYPFHMGLQHEKFHANTPAFVPSNFTFLPQHLRKLGYETHLVGKWHLGFCDTKYTPTARGFDSFFGYYTDNLDYYTHKDEDGYYDFWHNENVAENIEGLYSTSLLSDWAVDIVRNHDVGLPLFLVLAFQAVHAPIQVPQVYINTTCSHIQDPARQTMCGVVAAMDEAIGNITAALRKKDIFDDTIIIFTSDNGGVVSHGSSNSPLKGGYGELYEGGTRVTTLLSSAKLLSQTNQTFQGLFHQVDWLPTIVSMAGGDTAPILRDTDGYDQWHAVRLDGPSPRRELVYNFDDTVDNHFHNGALRVGDLKLVQGPPDFTYQMNDNNSDVRLYNLNLDPGEMVNIAVNNTKVDELRGRVKELRKTLVPGINVKPDMDSNPENFDGVWSPGWC